MERAFWMRSDGTLYPVASTHIAMVIEKPGMFGMSSEEIEVVYSCYEENVGFEGRARDRIILGLVRRGWIRIRRYPRKGAWTVNLLSLDRPSRRYLAAWAGQMLDMGMPSHDIVRLDLPDRVAECTLGEMGWKDDKLFP